MLGTILNLFGKSPFAPLQSHMEKVAECVEILPLIFAAVEAKNYAEVARLAEQVSQKEHVADAVKNNIRSHLPKSLFLAMDRGQLLEILSLQDNIADTTEDVAVLTTLKDLELLPCLRDSFLPFLHKNIETFHGVFLIVREMHELLETSFGGNEAEKVRTMIIEVAKKEHEADLLQRDLLKRLFAAEKELTFATFDLWQKIFGAIADISNLSEKLANRVRMTLELR